MRTLALTAAIAAVICMAVFAKEESPVRVRVFTDGEQCAVEDHQMRCNVVPTYLRDTLRIASDHPISVFVDGTQQSEVRGKRVSNLIRDAGYSQIVTIGFITEPGEGDG